MIRLHYYPGTAAMVPHILLEELGLPYERVLVDRAEGAHKRPEYLQLNPNGLIPVLVEGEVVLYETAAIALHLCDTHPRGGLVPPLAGAARAHFYKWLMWLTNTLQATLIVYFYPERWVDEGNASGAAEVKRHAERRIAGLLGQLDAEISRQSGPWFCGSAYTALDAYAFTLCRWTRNFRNEAPARSHPNLGPYLERMLARPAVQRVLANEKHAPPFV
jgi:glutathione S-transferase